MILAGFAKSGDDGPMKTVNQNIIKRAAGERGHANHGWLDARHTFSFADYHDPAWMGFRTLRVLNDDRIAPGMGFDMHPHRDMEIISYVLEGQLEHKDSMGNGRVIEAGEFQYMAAGTGVLHSEFNPSDTEPTHLLQIWIVPDRKGVTPRYAEKSARELPTGSSHLIASKSGRDDSFAIHQDADLWLATLETGDAVTHRLAANRHAWIHVAEGDVVVNGVTLTSGDAVALTGETEVVMTAKGTAQVLVFDLN
jgi:redox-sensitive bicupin YhaK (pirin superfamily)